MEVVVTEKNGVITAVTRNKDQSDQIIHLVVAGLIVRFIERLLTSKPQDRTTN